MTAEIEYNANDRYMVSLELSNVYQAIRLTYDWSDTIELEARQGRFDVRDTPSLLGPYENEDRALFKYWPGIRLNPDSA